jgi:hypothetical protein
VEDEPTPALRPITPLRPLRARTRRSRANGGTLRSLNTEQEA